jgi:hypothetical protein
MGGTLLLSRLWWFTLDYALKALDAVYLFAEFVLQRYRERDAERERRKTHNGV